MEPTFRLRFLGAVQITQDDEPVRGFESRKALALLGYLAAQSRPIPREQLVDLFWGDKSESRGRANLSWVLNRIATLLPGCLQADRHDVQFQHAPSYWLDIDAFAQLEMQRDPDSLAAAVALYQGEFLEGLSLDGCAEFELWLVGERERRRQQAVQALEALVTHHSQRGECEDSLRFARRLLALEPWREETHRQVMRLLARCGQRSAALAQYETCRRVLAEELGIDPLPETTVLYERIQTATLTRKPNLPTQPTRFVGREEDLAEIASMLNDPECRLLTILGPGGIGKTRLALQAVADQTQAFLEGVFFVPLAPLSAAEHLPSAIAEAIGLSLAGQGAPKRQILNYLRGKEMLLILDNFEHLLEGVEFIAEILRQAPEITLLVTSREPLNLRWEWRFEIEGLHYPAGDGTADLQDVANYSAIQLFEHIARRASPRFRLVTHESAVIRVCRLVDGLPLGIEMAATWVGAQTCAQIAKEIEENLNFLSTSMRDVPERHRSLRATFEHSWRLLHPHEQDALATLSVFRGGFQPEAACEVSGDSPNGLQALVDKSLLRCLPSGRCEMHELLRQYAAEKLSTRPEMEAKARDLHCTHYTTFLQAREDDLSGKRVSQALAAIKPEVANVRTAWGWAVQEAKLEDIGRCLDSLSRFYTLAGPFQEAGQLLGNSVDRVRALIEQADEKTPDRQILLGRLLVEQAHFLKAQGLYDLALAATQEAIDLASLLGETDPVVRLQATAHLEWGDVLIRRMDFEAARPQLEQSLALARAASLRPVEAATLRSLGGLFAKQGDYAGAGTCQEQALRLSREIGDQPGEIRALGSLGNVSLYQADYAQARVYYEQVLAIGQETGDRWCEASALVNLALSAHYQGDYTGATAYYEQALRTSQEIGDQPLEGHVLIGLGCVQLEQDHYAEARTVLGQALRVGHETNNQVLVTMALNDLGLTSTHQGDYLGAQTRYEESLRISRETGDRRNESFALSDLCLLAHYQGDGNKAEEYGQQALLVAQEIGEQVLLGYILSRLGCALEDLGRLTEAAEAYQQALDIRLTQGQQNQAVETLAGLARIALAQGDLHQAQTHVEEVLQHLETHGLEGADEPFRVRLTCYQILSANQDLRAREVLHTTHRLLQQQADRVGDKELRRSFLENVAAHREIVAAFESQDDEPTQV